MQTLRALASPTPLLLAALLGACALQPRAAAPGVARTKLIIENHHPEHVAVYLVYGATRQRVATLTRIGTHTVELTRWLAVLPGSDVQFEIRTFGISRGYLLPVFPMAPGDRLHMVVRSRPYQSTLWKASP